MLSRISNLGGGKFGAENAISNLLFGWVENLGRKMESPIFGKCYLESPIFGVENLGWKVLSRISNLGGGVEISNLDFGVESAISNLEWWKIWGGKCYLESRIWGVENLGWKMLSRISNLGGKCRKMLSRISNFWGGKFGAENTISNLEFGGWKIWGGKCYLESRIWGVENLGWKMLSRISRNLESRIWGVENLG